MIETLRKAASFLGPRERWRWLALIPLALVAAGLESLAAVGVLWLIQLVMAPLAADPTVSPSPLATTLDGTWIGGWIAHTPRLWAVAAVALLFLVKNSLHLAEVYLRGKLAAESAARIGTRLLGGYLRAPWSRHLGWNSAHLIRNATAGAETVTTTVLTSAVAAASELLAVAAILSVLVVAAPGRVLAAIAATAALIGLLLWLTQRSFERWGRGLHELAGRSHQTLQQTLAGAKVIKVLGRESFFERAFSQLRTSMAGILARRAGLAALPRLVVETVFVVALAVAVTVSIPTAADAASWVAFIGLTAYAGLRILPSVHLAVFHLNNVRFGRGAVDDLYRDWQDLVAAPPRPPGTAASEVTTLGFERELGVEGVSLFYDGASRPSLQDVSLTIRKGESVGIIGRTGSGKTTLLDLLLGLLDPTAGAVTVDGVDIRPARESWQRRVGYVPQDPQFLDDSLRRNIALGIEEGAIGEEQVAEAVRLARLEGLVARLPQGLDTVIGERGVRLSGGERQRVAIARALYHRPEVLFFDEATSALDRETEREVQEGIEALRRSKTLVVVAHRLATVRGCDRVVLLRDGRIADVGSFDELLVRDRELQRGTGAG